METWESTIEGLWSFSDHGDQHRQNIEARHAGTCRWIFDNSTYREWENDPGKILFITGPPGIGKSILASAIIEQFRDERAAAYLFCDHFSATTVSSFYRCILRQLAEDVPYPHRSDVLSQLQTLVREADQGIHEEGQRWHALDLVLRTRGLDSDPPTLVIDGLDALSDEGLLHLASATQTLQNEFHFNILVTSRCIFPQLDVLDDAYTLELAHKDTDNDLKRYIRHRLGHNEELEDTLGDLVPSIADGAEGIFLFATRLSDCVLAATYESDRNRPDAWKMLDSSLDTFFGKLLDNVLAKSDVVTVSCALNWLLYAERPFSMRELQHALAANATRHLWNSKEPLHQAVEPLYHTVNPNTVLSALRGLVQVDKFTGVIRFFHSAAEGYLRQHAERLPGAQEMITEACIRILAFACLPSPSEANWVIEDSSDEPEKPRSASSRNEVKSSDEKFEDAPSRTPWLPRMMDKLYPTSQPFHSYQPQHNGFQVKLQMPANQGFFRSGREYEEKLHIQPLLQYAACNWGYHARLCAVDDQILGLLQDRIRLDGICQTLTYENTGYSPKYPRDVTGLHLAAYFGLKDVAARLLDAGDPVSPRDSYGETPLWWAAKNNQEEVARLLSEKDSVTLHLLIQANKSSLMKFLLKVGYNINTTDVEKRTPLHAAVKEKDVEIAQRLIQAGADIDATDINGTSPLSLAMEMRNFELMSMLVANQADTRSLGLERIRTVFGLRSSDSLEIYESRQDGTRIMRQLPREFSWTTDMVFDTARFSMNLLKLTDKVPGLEELGLNHLLNFKREKSVPFNLRVEQLTETTPEGSVWIYFLQISLPAAGRDFETYVCWNAVSHTDQDGLVTWKTTASISGLTKIWLPAKGIELFQSLMSEIQRRWSSIIRSTMSTANSQRRGQILEASGNDPWLLHLLLKDALRPVHYRRHLQNMVTEARKFAVDYCKRHDEATSLDAILKQIEAFDHDVGDYIDQLDRLSQSLIELEFNFVSIKEARQSVKMARSLKRLSWITFIFLPLTFVATSFGMNIDILADNPAWWYYLPFAGVTIFLTSAVWLLFKFSKLEDIAEKAVASFTRKKNMENQRRNFKY